MADGPSEKNVYNVEQNAEHGGIHEYAGERKGSVAMNEAEALYGDIEDAEHYGYVSAYCIRCTLMPS